MLQFIRSHVLLIDAVARTISVVSKNLGMRKRRNHGVCKRDIRESASRSGALVHQSDVNSEIPFEFVLTLSGVVVIAGFPNNPEVCQDGAETHQWLP